MSMTLRPYRDADEDALITLWHRTWQHAYPSIDFAERLPAWRVRWREELVPGANIIVAERGTESLGFVTIDRSGYLDQLVVAPEEWGSSVAAELMQAAKELSPQGIRLLVNADNDRAIRFYERQGFRHIHDDINPVSGRPVKAMAWLP
jgi:putative acetyltransferase